MKLHIKVKKIHQDAKIPVYSSEHAAGFDFFAIESGIVVPSFPKRFRTGLQFEIPENYVMMIYSRSGHGFKNNVRLSNCTGIIDSDYRSEVLIKLIQDDVDGTRIFNVEPGDKIAQGIVLPRPKIQFIETDILSETERGEGGFGSTGR